MKCKKKSKVILKNAKGRSRLKDKSKQLQKEDQVFLCCLFFSHEMSWIRSWVSFWGFSYLLFEAWSKKGSSFRWLILLIYWTWLYTYIATLKNVKKEKGNTVCHLVAKSICVKESAFSADFTQKLYLNKHTRCLLKKCKENLLYFQERLLTTSPG